MMYLKSLAFLHIILIAILCSGPVSAQEATGPLPNRTPKVFSPIIQLTDGEIAPLDKKNGLTVQQELEVKGLTHFLVGHLRIQENKLEEAYKEFKAAADTNPKSARLYQILMQLADALNKNEEVLRFAKKLSEVNPDNYKLFIQLALSSIQANDVDGALRYFELASKSKELNKKSRDYVLIMNELGRLYYILEKYEDAAKSFEILYDVYEKPEAYSFDRAGLQKLNPNIQEFYEDLGTVFLETKRFDLAKNAFTKSAEAARSGKEVIGFHLARVNFKQEKWTEAKTELNKYFEAKLKTRGLAPYELLSDILNKENKSDLLLAELEGLRKNDPENYELLNYLADYYLDHNELSKAEELLEKSREIKNTPGSKIGFLKLYRKSKNAEKLLVSFAKLIGDRTILSRLETEITEVGKDTELCKILLEHGQARQKTEDKKLSFAETFLLGKIAIQVKNVNDAKFFYNLAFSLNSERKSQLTRELVLFLLREKQYADAQKLIEEALDDAHKSEEKADYTFLLSETHRLNKKIDDAINAIRDVQKIDPDNSNWLLQEGIIFSYSHQWANAIKVYEKVIKAYPDEDDVVRQAKMSMSNAYVLSGDYPKGEKILEEVYNADPEDIGVNNDLGYLYADNNTKLDQAEKMVQKALDSEPENGAYIDSMGWVMYRRGKHKEALEFLLKAVEKREGGDAVIYDHLADCYHALGQKDKAIEYWKKAVEDEEKNAFPTQSLIDKIKKKLSQEK